MGTRLAPLVLLLLAACMATGGTEPAVRDGSNPASGATAAAQTAPPGGLPAIPRMRPKALRTTPQAGPAVAQADTAARDAGSPASGGGEGAGPSAGGSSVAKAAAMAQPGSTAAAGQTAPADTADAQSAGSGSSPDPQAGVDDPAMAGPAAGDAAFALLQGGDASSTPAGTMPDPAPSTHPAEASRSGIDADSAGTGPAEDPETALAIALPPELDPGIDVESLFDGDVVRYCEAMWQMGEYIGAARRRGQPFKQSIGDAVRRIAAEKQLPLDNRLAFSGQVYGRLVYRLEDSHAALTLGTYVHFACLTVRGDKKIVPADPNAERLLNSGLAYCESTAFTRDALNDCIFRELTPIVDRRNG